MINSVPIDFINKYHLRNGMKVFIKLTIRLSIDIRNFRIYYSSNRTIVYLN